MVGQQRIHSLVILAALCSCVPVAGYLAGGFSTRFMVDDYCYQARFDDGGFWQTQWDSYFKWAEYSGNRYSLTLMYGVNSLLGRSAIRFFAPAVMLSLISAAAFLLWNLGRISGKPFRWPHLLLGSCALLFFTIYQAPNVYQALYWFSSMMTYTAPLSLLTWLAGWMLWQAQRGMVSRQGQIHPAREAWQPGSIVLMATGLLSFLGSGFSETNAALQAGGLLLALLPAAWFKQRGSRLAARLLPLLTAALAGTLFGMAALVFSPTNAPRQAAYRAPPGVVDLVLIALRFGFDFTWESIKGGPLPIAMTVLTFGFIAMSTPEGVDSSLPNRKLAAGLALTGLMVYLLVVCCAAPTVYARTAYPEGRTWITGRFVMVAGAAVMGWLLGIKAAHSGRKISLRKAEFLLAGLALLLCAYSLRSSASIYPLVPHLQKRAAAWDQRDLLIRQARDAGQRDLVVPAIDSISQVIELQDDPGYWVNGCAARFYGVDSITALE